MESAQVNAESVSTIGFAIMSAVAILCAIASGLTIYLLDGMDRRARDQERRLRALEDTPGVRTLLDLKKIANGKL